MFKGIFGLQTLVSSELFVELVVVVPFLSSPLTLMCLTQAIAISLSVVVLLVSLLLASRLLSISSLSAVLRRSSILWRRRRGRIPPAEEEEGHGVDNSRWFCVW